MGRDYRGMSAAERLADRRERLITAAYTLFAHPGFHSTTIERLCATARISNRAFYECFSSREDLMRAVYDRCVEETLASVNAAIEKAPPTLDDRIVAGIGEYVRFVTQDVRRARVMHLEVRRAGNVLTNARQHTVKAFTEIIEEAVQDLPQRPPLELHLLALGLIGAITELLIEWVLADPAPSTDRLVDASVHIFRRTFGPEPTPEPNACTG
ncbi:TetR/AcrR family transcriptional regulator [Planotetraspora sp. A-T 1434]|uniref:TetR/AcrR family transcriptional regulator n=1 Tax=Planotetraspora sp. A-T 1434 TaxID=2979219 RepID=UPI0021C189BB|nr:TetR/AcrR family transcriptional regulator [Planotetraspora sp. A-T 1434]MCT9929086.1 TetR/AcrR family transcriptional regulator [Planotetraspora sp. A-T 1434]